MNSKFILKTVLTTSVLLGSAVYSFPVKAFLFDQNVMFSLLASKDNSFFHSVADETRGSAAQKFVSGMGDKAIGFLSDEALSQSQKEKEFRALLQAHFDMSTIGRFVLGKNWKTASDSQKKEYQKLFEDLIVRIYAGRFNDYKGEAFDVSSFRESGKKDVLVTSYIIPNSGSKVQVDWRVRNKNGKQKIIDVIIEGVSMSLTQRSDFSSVIQRGGGEFEVLLAHLRQ